HYGSEYLEAIVRGNIHTGAGGDRTGGSEISIHGRRIIPHCIIVVESVDRFLAEVITAAEHYGSACAAIGGRKGILLVAQAKGDGCRGRRKGYEAITRRVVGIVLEGNRLSRDRWS